MSFCLLQNPERTVVIWTTHKLSSGKVAIYFFMCLKHHNCIWCTKNSKQDILHNSSKVPLFFNYFWELKQEEAGNCLHLFHSSEFFWCPRNMKKGISRSLLLCYKTTETKILPHRTLFWSKYYYRVYQSNIYVYFHKQTS